MVPRLAAGLLLAFNLSGCLTYEYEHEFWLNVDGSGTVNVTTPDSSTNGSSTPPCRRGLASVTALARRPAGRRTRAAISRTGPSER